MYTKEEIEMAKKLIQARKEEPEKEFYSVFLNVNFIRNWKITGFP
jgi:hypothetical protein